MKTIYLFTFYALSLLFFGCDYINPEVAYEQKAEPSTKKVFLEVYTGVQCVNCPASTKKGLDNINSAGYSDNIIIMKIHSSSFFGFPLKETTQDLRTTTAKSLETEFGIGALPTGVVGRRKVNSSYPVSTANWVTEVGKIVNDPNYAPLDLELKADYSKTSRKLELSLEGSILKNIDKKINVLAYLTEDSIVQPQKDGNEINLNFVHRHAMRTQLEGNGGNLFFNKASAQATVNKSFNAFTLPALWKDNHCSVIVIATDASTGEVIQVEETKIIE